MGAAVSNNAASAVSNVSNYVSNSTTADDQDVTNITNTTTWNRCWVSGSVNEKATANVISKSRQIVKALQHANVKNTIAQKMLQEAMSSIGSMGVGYASASNSASEFASSSSTIINAMKVSASKSAYVNNTWDCNHSHFGGNINIGFSNDVDFLSDQTLSNTAVQTLVTSISQTVSQKAAAKVAGLAGFLIALAILIGVIGYALSKPLDTKAAKYIIGAALVIGLGLVVIFLWISRASPFFNKNLTCNPFASGSTKGCGTDCIDCCINKKLTTISLAKYPPLRYIYPIFHSEEDDEFVPGLLEMCISRSGDNTPGNMGGCGGNGGWNGGNYKSMFVTDPDLWEFDSTYTKFKVPQLPNPLTLQTTCELNSVGTVSYFKIPAANTTGISAMGIVQPGAATIHGCTSNILEAIASTNSDKWNTYCTSNDPSLYPNSSAAKRASHARFVLCKFLGIPCDSYTMLLDGEAEETSDSENSFKFSKYAEPAEETLMNAIKGGGELTGLFGVCDNRLYQIHIFMGKLGWWIAGGIVIIIIVFIYIKHKNAGPP